MKLIKEQDIIKIYYDDSKYVVTKNDSPLLTFIDGDVHFINDDLVVVRDDVINIYQSIRQGLVSSSIISKQGIVLAKPMLYNNVIIVVFKDGIVQFDTNLNVVKSLSYEVNGIISQERIVDNYFIFVINSNNKEDEIIYDIENNIIKQNNLDCCHLKKLIFQESNLDN